MFQPAIQNILDLLCFKLTLNHQTQFLHKFVLKRKRTINLPIHTQWRKCLTTSCFCIMIRNFNKLINFSLSTLIIIYQHVHVHMGKGLATKTCICRFCHVIRLWMNAYVVPLNTVYSCMCFHNERKSLN